MFAVYNIQGLQFRDSLERLRKLQATTPITGIRAQSSATVGDTRTNSARERELANNSGPSGKALQAYRQTRKPNNREPICHAHQVMSSPVSTLVMSVDVTLAWEHFQKHDVRQVPVLNEQQRIVGMLSLEDLLKYVIVDGGNVQFVRDRAVKDAMTHTVLTADPVTDIRRIAQLMHEYRLNAVPIVDESHALVGLVSRTDLLRALANNPPLSLWT